MESAVPKGLTRFLSVIVIILMVCDAVLVITSPWWVGILNRMNIVKVMAVLGGMFLSIESGSNYAFYLAFTIINGVLAFLMLIEAYRVLSYIGRGSPFCVETSGFLRNAAVFAFCIAAVFLLSLFFTVSILMLLCSLVFILFGLFMLVLSNLFNTAARIKEENDLTI